MKRITQNLQILDMFSYDIAFQRSNSPTYSSTVGLLFSFLVYALIAYLILTQESTNLQYSFNPDAIQLNDQNLFLAIHLKEGKTDQIQIENVLNNEEVNSLHLVVCNEDKLKKHNIHLTNLYCLEDDFQIYLQGLLFDTQYQYARIQFQSNVIATLYLSNQINDSQYIEQVYSSEIVGSYNINFHRVNSQIIRSTLQPTNQLESTIYLYRDPLTISDDVRNTFTIDMLLAYVGGLLYSISHLGFLIKWFSKLEYYIELSNSLFNFDLVERDKAAETSAQSPKKGTIQLNQSYSNVNQSQSNVNQSQSNVNQSQCKLSQERQERQERSRSILFSNKNLYSISSFMQSPKKTITTYRNTLLIEKHQNMIEQLGITNKKQYFQAQILELIMKMQKVNFSFRFVLHRLTCKRLFNSPQVRLLDKAVERLGEELEIERILEKVNEFEKFKSVILSKPQQIMFNFIPKPIIGFKEQKRLPSKRSINMNLSTSRVQFEQSQSRLMEQTNKLGLGKITQKALNLKMKQEYKQIYQNSPVQVASKFYKAYAQVNECQSDHISRQLIRSLGQEVRQIFDVSLLLNYPRTQQFTLQEEQSSGNVSSEEKSERIDQLQIKRQI